MTRLSPILALTALTLGLLLAFPGATRGFVLSGDTLGLDQRDFRVFDNFDDPFVNINQVREADYPGATGAALAIWKACAEWGSGLHGSGGGDFHQPGGLGSGGANFDALFQGMASGVGGIDENTHSQIGGSGLGVIAFTETPTSDGWRIRYRKDPWNWRANASATVFANVLEKDLQGIATHEYGHALGLGHSANLTATMRGVATGFGVDLRSLEGDDVLGVQAIYGMRDSAKPVITTWRLVGGQGNPTVEIEGTNFGTLSGLEVWFPNAAAGANGDPIAVPAGSVNAAGTTVSVTRPANAGRGDFAVKRAGQNGAVLSNGFPFNPVSPPCAAPEIFGTSKLTSLQTIPDLYVLGSPQQSLGNFGFGCDTGIPNAMGILFFGPSRAARPFFGGTRHAGTPLQRDRGFQFDFGGQLSLPIVVEDAMLGQTRIYQLWFRDLGDPFGVGLSNGVEVRFCP